MTGPLYTTLGTLAAFSDPPDDAASLPPPLYEALASSPWHVLHAFACGCAERALFREEDAGRPLSSLAWEALFQKLLYIEGSAAPQTMDRWRLSLFAPLKDARAAAQRAPSSPVPWASLVALECLESALVIHDEPFRIARHTSIQAFRAAISAARASTPPRSVSLAAEEERSWQHLYFYSLLDQLEKKRASFLSLLRSHPSRLAHLRHLHASLEEQLF